MSILGICAGYEHTCALFNNGNLKCFGSNTDGRLGLGIPAEDHRGDGTNEMGGLLPYVNYGTGVTAKEVMCGDRHTCVLFTNGASKCWGGNGSGQLALGDTSSRGASAPTMGNSLPVCKWGTGRTVKKIAPGHTHTCAILDNNELKCAGWGLYGQLGYGSTSDKGGASNTVGDSLGAVNLGASRYPVKIAGHAFADHNCAILDDNKVKCWGYNYNGQLGVDSWTNKGILPADMGNGLAYVNLGTGRTALQVSVGPYNSCAIRDDETTRCWGSNSKGQAGIGDTYNIGDWGTYSWTMTNVPAMQLGTSRKAKKLAVGNELTCFVLDNNTVKCFGAGDNGKSGQGNANSVGGSPTSIGNNLAAISLGTSLTIASIHAGKEHVCVHFQDTTSMKCWGLNIRGQLGLSDSNSRGDGANEMGANLPFPYLLPTISSPPSISLTEIKGMCAGANHNCVLFNDNVVKCFGKNDKGQLGLGDTQPRGDDGNEMSNLLPAVLYGSFTPNEIQCGAEHTCLRFTTGGLKCWGSNASGRLVLGDTNNRGDNPFEMDTNLPLSEFGSVTISSVVAGEKHICILASTGVVRCGGDNTEGILGYDDKIQRGSTLGLIGNNFANVNLGAGLTATAIYSGSMAKHTCAKLSNQKLKCWGLNDSGQLGLGDTKTRGDGIGGSGMGDSLQYVDIGNNGIVFQVSLGSSHTCAVIDDGNTRCWGLNNGNLGIASTATIGDAAGEMGSNLGGMQLGTDKRGVMVKCGYRISCVLLADNILKCFGVGGPQLGQGDSLAKGVSPSTSGNSLPGISLGTSLPVENIISGEAHVCAKFSGTNIKCWGVNGFGQLGQGNTVSKGSSPTHMGANLPFSSVFPTPTPSPTMPTNSPNAPSPTSFTATPTQPTASPILSTKSPTPPTNSPNLFTANPTLASRPPNCPSACPTPWLSDNFCDSACNTPLCNLDKGDCRPANCPSSCPTPWLGDHYCDPECNENECNYDYGDCLPTLQPTMPQSTGAPFSDFDESRNDPPSQDAMIVGVAAGVPIVAAAFALALFFNMRGKKKRANMIVAEESAKNQINAAPTSGAAPSTAIISPSGAAVQVAMPDPENPPQTNPSSVSPVSDGSFQPAPTVADTRVAVAEPPVVQSVQEPKASIHKIDDDIF